MAVLAGGRPVPGSPFRAEVAPGQVSAGACRQAFLPASRRISIDGFLSSLKMIKLRALLGCNPA